MADEPDNTELAIGCVSFLASPLLIWWDGWVLVHLWRWFLVPLGIVNISTAHACGIGLLISYMTQKCLPHRKQSELLAWNITTPAVVLLIGYVIQRWFL